jgi:Flp pilus assembly protein TadG
MEGALNNRELTAPAERGLPPRRVRVRDERGTAVVEFAIIILPLLLIVFGVLDFGRALNYYNDLTQIAGQGARAAAVNENPLGGAANGSFQQQLADGATTGELHNGITVCITQMPSSSTPTGTPVSVRTKYVFHFIPLIRAAALTLSTTQTERYESPSNPTFSAAGDVQGSAGCP